MTYIHFDSSLIRLQFSRHVEFPLSPTCCLLASCYLLLRLLNIPSTHSDGMSVECMHAARRAEQNNTRFPIIASSSAARERELSCYRKASSRVRRLRSVTRGRCVTEGGGCAVQSACQCTCGTYQPVSRAEPGSNTVK